MEPRLWPLNALLGLVTPGDVNPAALADTGFRLEGLEVPITGPHGTVTVDVLLFHEASMHLLLCEVKSGANADAKQAQGYAAVEPDAVVQAAHITLPRRAPLTAEAVYVCRGTHLDRIKQSLSVAETRLPILAVHDDEITMGSADASDQLQAAFAGGPVPMPAPPPRLIPFDHDSPVEVVVPFVRAQLVAGLATRVPVLTVPTLTEQTAPCYGVYGRGARNQLRRRVEAAVRNIVQAEPETFAYHPPSRNQDGLVRLLKTPEDNDTRGRTQAYQALTRKRHTGRRRPPHDPNQLDLLREVDWADDVGDDEDPLQEGVTP